MSEQLPKTVTACHAEITRLQERILDLEGEKDKLQDEVSSVEDRLEEVEEVEEFVAAKDLDIFGAVERLLDECERVGTLRYDLVQSDRASAAIVELHDIVGRNA
jgi:predicted  nucleic acid-binding Zn-ribbon protein